MMINIFTVFAEAVDMLDKIFDKIRGIEDPDTETGQSDFDEVKEMICELRDMFGKKEERGAEAPITPMMMADAAKDKGV